jgi:signal transduction histidine kinase
MTAAKRIQFGFLLIALAPVLLGLMAYANASKAIEAARDVARTNELVKELEKVLSTLKDVEVAQREYLLTAEEARVTDIQRLQKEAEAGVNRLAIMKAEDYWLEQLRTLVPQKFDEIRKTVELRRSGDFVAASEVVLRDRGSRAMDDIRTAVRNMIRDENLELGKRSTDQQKKFRWTMIIFGAVLLLNGVLIGSLFWTTTRTNAELERRVAVRTEELQRSNEELQQFAYVASHDMKEPMRMISSYASLLERRYQDKLGEDAQTYIGFIVEGVKRMDAMIAGLLEYSRVGETKEGDTAVRVETEKVLSGVLDNLKVTVSDANAVVTHDPLPDVYYDPIRLGQLLQNLVSNAIKYRSPERRPHVHITASQRHDEVVFSIRDNGEGIPPEHRDDIFGIFKRLHGKEVEGTGIGLAMCRRIVERYGGRIWVDSEPGVGSTFSFTIPKSYPLASGAAG